MSILKKICDDNGVMVTSVQIIREALPQLKDFEASGGLALSLGGKSYIGIEDGMGLWEEQLCASYEIAHLLFGHLKEKTIASEQQEREAPMFSSCLIALMLF